MIQPTDIETLADRLSASANALHTQLMRAIRRGEARELTQQLFDNEIALRTQADSLYLDAAQLAALGLSDDTRQLLDLASRAAATVARIDRIKDLLDLSAELLTLAAAIAAGKPEHVIKPLEDLKHHLEAL
ncbi:hypothetical protein [Duganella callida]|uniref:Uncharacterized protein n=1 Tax=Duganella callida TaxID=2561932 RepID=A0A4Y9ST10_9BURK|nr:hypothetical protein [Duganella callida]TFW28637.1 hypothetical protein E4L98_05435 [Duganella callida]